MSYSVFKTQIEHLNSLKREIDKYPDEWEVVKRKINPYEHIFSGGSSRISVAKIQPISRAFFKMIELIYPYKDIYTKPIRVLHLAESPGGFVQAWDWLRKNKAFVDDTMAITLQKTKTDMPWKRLQEVSRTWTRRPHMLLGDLLDDDCRTKIVEDYKLDKASLVTGDGGFDFSLDYCSQEEQAIPLILSEFVIALRCIADGGTLVLKVFDTFTLPMIQIIWVCSVKFEKFKLVKPKTSRACNSEKYIVASGFKGICDNLETFLKRCEGILEAHSLPITTLFTEGQNSKYDTMVEGFRNTYEKNIRSLCQQQIYWIEKGLRQITGTENDTETESIVSNDIPLSLNWCRQHSVPINPYYYENYHRSWGRETSQPSASQPPSPLLRHLPHT